MVLPFSDYHNMIGNLSLKSKESKPFKEIVKFLQMSEIAYCITANPTIYEEHIRSFWSSAYFVVKDNRRYISATVQGKVIEVTEATIRAVLKLAGPDQYEMTNQELVKHLHRMGYEGDAYNLKMIKSQVSFNWRYLWHIIIHVFAARKAGWDNLTLDLAKGMACMCLGRPFNWAKLILENMKNNAQTSLNKKFLLYPRFIQMIINFKVKDLKREGNVLNLGIMRDRVWNTMRSDHARSTFSKKFTPLFDEMLIAIGRISSSSDDVPSASSTPERKADKESEKVEQIVERRSKKAQEKEVSSSSEEDVPVAKPLRKSPRIVLKKVSPRARTAKRPSAITDTEDEPVVKKKKIEVPKVKIPKTTPIVEESIPVVEETISEIPEFVPEEVVRETASVKESELVMSMLEKILKKQEDIAGDIATLKMEMMSEMHTLEDNMLKKVQRMIVDELKDVKDCLLSKKKKVVDIEEVESSEELEEVAEVIEKKEKTDETVIEKIDEKDAKFEKDDGQDYDFERMNFDLDLSFLDEHHMEIDEEIVAEQIPTIVQESSTVQERVDNSMAIIVYSSPLDLIKQIPNKTYKGKDVIQDKCMWIHFDNSTYEKPVEIVKDKVIMMEDENVILPDWVLNSEDQEVYTYASSKSFINPADEVRDSKKEDVLFLSRIEENVEITGGTDLIVVEDIDLKAEKKKAELEAELKKRVDDEKSLYRKLVTAEKRAALEKRLAEDSDFVLVFNRMKSYVENEEALWNKTPDEIVLECYENDCKRVVNLIYERCQENAVSEEQILDDISAEVSTLTVSQMKEFLKRYGFISYQVNKMSVEDMADNVKEIQLRLLKKIPRDQAEQMFDAGLFDIPKDFENRARFFSTQFPQISTQRIAHWKYDGQKNCYLIKRVTGATHALYSSQEVARLTEEDLYELADLKIDDEEDHDEVMMFTKFLKRQKKKNFEDINFSHPQSIRTHTIAYLQAEGMSLREILKDQYLCLKYKDVPRKSNVNLLDKLKKWYLDSRTYEYVFERYGLDSIRFYHPSEINMFTSDDLKRLLSMPPMGKSEWNACILEMLEDIAKGLLRRQTSKKDEQTREEEKKRKKEEEEKEKEKEKKEPTRKKQQRIRRGTGIKIRD